MSSKVVIMAENLTKEYRIHKTNGQRLLSVLFGIKSGMRRTAVSNVSFEIHKGEKVAFLGQLGSGRSTLLKLIAGITGPTSGKLIVRESTNPLFDLRGGFVPELSGYDNIFIKGTLLGLSRAQIHAHLDDIVSFSGIEDYLSLPMKTYAPYMSSMLGFAIHTAVKPEILVMDENFAVGDKVKKEKCTVRLKQMVDQEDVTYVMTTRNLPFAKRMCQRGILMEKGQIVFDGDINEAIKEYKRRYKPASKKKKAAKKQAKEASKA